ncbi:uncharacterized protein LOC124450276 isoform X2 [Xenia sp. Carnegie-2017]|uniref:uncharacterized protein LOC124450276 isoform X2 n=1 Tax=Xenia sp. Carnegie-2017 TaxID=2897299 RepID=UPI001F03F0B3|nr:uncharacterized protein LOC124450276 isoform X2 [Xenia sp. Carnegie-2017]
MKKYTRDMQDQRLLHHHNPHDITNVDAIARINWKNEKPWQSFANKSKTTRGSAPHPKIDSWIKPNNADFEVMGTKMPVKGNCEMNMEDNSSCQMSNKRGTVLVNTRTSEKSFDIDRKTSSPIDLIVGTSCFKKDFAIDKVSKKEEARLLDEDAKNMNNSSNSMANLLSCWLSKINLSKKSFTKCRKLDSTKNEEVTCEKCCQDELFEKACAQIKHFIDKDGEKFFNSKNGKRPTDNNRINTKWNAVEKLICTGHKANNWTREQVIEGNPLQSYKVENCQQTSDTVKPFVPASAKQPIIIPDSTMNTFKPMNEDHSVQMTAYKESIKLKDKHCENNERKSYVDWRSQMKPKILGSHGIRECGNPKRSAELKNNLAIGSTMWINTHLSAAQASRKLEEGVLPNGIV